MFPYTCVAQNFEESDCEYELVGVIVHRGEDIAGHYISFVKGVRDTSYMGDTCDVWHEFDDDNVILFDPDDQHEGLEARCFGGKYARNGRPPWWERGRNGTKTENAVLLLYRRYTKTAIDPSSVTEEHVTHGEKKGYVSALTFPPEVLLLNSAAITTLQVIFATLNEGIDNDTDSFRDLVAEAQLHYLNHVVFANNDESQIQQLLTMVDNIDKYQIIQLSFFDHTPTGVNTIRELKKKLRLLTMREQTTCDQTGLSFTHDHGDSAPQDTDQ
jgi:hypothetical protein